MREPIQFGKYTLLDRISSGGMAEVFRATGPGGNAVAIKRILPSMAEDQMFVKMFVEEARTTAQLVHPNVCRVYELGRAEGTHFIAMELVDGKDVLRMQQRLRRLDQPAPLAMACAIIARAADGLDYAHKKKDPFGRELGLVHRDCSPHNILVSFDGAVKVIDFGIAKAMAKSANARSGALKGKFAYMSPEQVCGQPIDRRSDIFAIGLVLYELVTGAPAFAADSDFGILEKVRNVDIRPPREVFPDLPRSIERVLELALAKDVDARYSWCSEMREDLERIGAAPVADLATFVRRLFAD